MPGKYSHVKKRPPTKPKKAASASVANNGGKLNQPMDGTLSSPIPPLSPTAKLERTIARVLLVRYEQDVARLFSTHLFTVALVHLPIFVVRCAAAAGPGWVAVNGDSDTVKDFLRAIIGMELRQAGERVATKSVLWSYMALRHFAMSNGVNVCARRGLYSAALLPHYDALQAHLETLEHAPPPAFARPPSLGPLTEGLLVLEEACESRFGSPPRARQRYAVSQRTCDHCGAAHGGRMVPERRCTIPPRDGKTAPISEEEEQWRAKVRVGYERVCQTLWRVAREFDVRGYGLVLREKLEHKWCHCGCSTDHLGEVCERTVREEEDVRARERDRAAVGGPSAKRKGKAVCDEPTPTLDRAHDFGTKGKEREWDGRGSGVYGWGTEEEEDVWELELDFAQGMPEEQHGGKDNNNGKSDYTNTNRPTSRDPDECNMTVGELMNWRYFKAEREKEVGNTAFKAGAYGVAILHYERAHAIEPEVPHYQLNIAAAHLKLSRWAEAEAACTKALTQHRSSKGYFRRARARRMLGRREEAIKDLRAALKIQPTNSEAREELDAILPIAPPRLNSSPPKLQKLYPPDVHPRNLSDSTTSVTSSSSFGARASSSFQASEPVAAGTSSIGGGSSTSKGGYALPFALTPADERKLQFVFTPMNIDMTPLPNEDGVDPPPDKREKRSFVYPSWDRYSVKRIWA